MGTIVFRKEKPAALVGAEPGGALGTLVGLAVGDGAGLDGAAPVDAAEGVGEAAARLGGGVAKEVGAAVCGAAGVQARGRSVASARPIVAARRRPDGRITPRG
jgi:hypothetical protein